MKSKPKWHCRIGWHIWFHGQFAQPVWGRWERRCLWCRKKQYREYKNKRHKWITYEVK